MGILLPIVGNAIALLATTVVPGITFSGNWLTLFVAGLVFGLFNADRAADRLLPVACRSWC